MYEYSFERLNVWQQTRNMVKQIYLITERYIRHEQYGLVDQMRRAAISVSSNIAEGSSRNSKKDQAHFYNMAYSSLMELLSQIILSLDLEYIKHEEYLDIRNSIEYISNQLNSLRKSLS